MSKAIAITGRGAGLGLTMAQRLARDGHELFLLARTFAKVEMAATQIGSNAHAVACDVADPNSVDAAFAQIAEKRARLDVLINNAGIFAPFFLAEATNAQIAGTRGTNLAGPMYCSRAALGMMGRGRHIICIGSETVTVTAAMLGAYQTAKAGLERFCLTLDQEVAAQGIRVTLIRAGQMYGPDMGFLMNPDVAARFAEESLKLGMITGRTQSASSRRWRNLSPSCLPCPTTRTSSRSRLRVAILKRRRTIKFREALQDAHSARC